MLLLQPFIKHIVLRKDFILRVYYDTKLVARARILRTYWIDLFDEIV